jgi:hypothetical protein
MKLFKMFKKKFKRYKTGIKYQKKEKIKLNFAIDIMGI